MFRMNMVEENQLISSSFYSNVVMSNEFFWTYSDLIHFFMVCFSQILLCLPLRKKKKKLSSCFLPDLLITLCLNTAVNIATLHNTFIVTQNSAITQLQYREDYIKSNVYSVLTAS